MSSPIDPEYLNAVDLVTQIKITYPNKYETFLNLMGEFKQITIRDGRISNGIDPNVEKLCDRMRKLIGKDKELWVKFVHYLPKNSQEKMKLIRESRQRRQSQMPIKLSADTFLLIAKQLPPLSLSRLSKTCMWANALITPSVFEEARKKARLTHGLFSVVSSRDLVIKNTNDEPITISPVDEGLSSLRVQMDGRRYVAEDASGNDEMAGLLANVLSADDETHKKTKIWYRFTRQSRDLVHIDLSVSNDGQIVKKAAMVCILP